LSPKGARNVRTPNVVIPADDPSAGEPGNPTVPSFRFASRESRRKMIRVMTPTDGPDSATARSGPGRFSDPVLEEMVRRVVRRLRPERVYLFGSRARGEAGPDSDYDLMVVVPDSPLPGYKRDQIAFRALMGLGVSKDVIVLTRDEFERKSTVFCSLPATVLREGELLYVA
jgi:uncharacterized protein